MFKKKFKKRIRTVLLSYVVEYSYSRFFDDWKTISIKREYGNNRLSWDKYFTPFYCGEVGIDETNQKCLQEAKDFYNSIESYDDVLKIQNEQNEYYDRIQLTVPEEYAG